MFLLLVNSRKNFILRIDKEGVTLWMVDTGHEISGFFAGEIWNG